MMGEAEQPWLTYGELNDTERRIVDGWIAEGMDKQEALRQFTLSLDDFDGDME